MNINKTQGDPPVSLGGFECVVLELVVKRELTR
jgi:hypothetical protein